MKQVVKWSSGQVKKTQAKNEADRQRAWVFLAQNKVS